MRELSKELPATENNTKLDNQHPWDTLREVIQEYKKSTTESHKKINGLPLPAAAKKPASSTETNRHCFYTPNPVAKTSSLKSAINTTSISAETPLTPPPLPR